MDAREYQRVTSNIECLVYADQLRDETLSSILNFSEAGLYVSNAVLTELSINDTIQISFIAEYKEYGLKTIETIIDGLNCKVVRKDAEGIGLVITKANRAYLDFVKHQKLTNYMRVIQNKARQRGI